MSQTTTESNPRYGTLGDFVEFTQGCRQRGLRVLIDLVVNHTSDQHPWFQEARRDPKSKYRDWYVWSKKKPKNAASGVVFPGVQKTTWSYDEVAKAYYFHRFYDFQPDLNTANPEVQAEILKIMGFWLQLGVSGFRMDAVPFVISAKGAKVAKPQEDYEMLRTFSQFLSWREGDAIILAEANVLPDTDMNYFGAAGERVQMMFNFDVNQHLFLAMATADSRPLKRAMQSTKRRPATAQWGLFLRNHDELDLGRLEDKQREAVFAAFGPEPDMQLYNRGIRRRLAPMLEGDRRRLGTRLQPDDDAARHARDSLRRRDRHGRQSQVAGTQLCPHAHAVVYGTAMPASPKAISRSCRSSATALMVSSTST